MSTAKRVKIDSWVQDILVDPLDKHPLRISEYESCLVSNYGRTYPITDGVCDLRLLNNRTTRDQRAWSAGQTAYVLAQAAAVRTNRCDYRKELADMAEVYRAIPIVGDCLDVGGHQGRLRAFLAASQKYVCCDPLIDVLADIASQPAILEAYPFLNQPFNFVACDAEFLPFAVASFDVIHMRSVIDHFLNPELALNEAYRVLRAAGSLIIGSYVLGGRRGRVSGWHRTKDIIRWALPYIGIHGLTDHHIWHPTFDELCDLLNQCGFVLDKVHWQQCHEDQVCYILARKTETLRRGHGAALEAATRQHTYGPCRQTDLLRTRRAETAVISAPPSLFTIAGRAGPVFHSVLTANGCRI